MNESSLEVDWLRALKRYLAFMLLASLTWETAQLPLYSIWSTANSRTLAFAVAHCTLGDLLIATSVLIVALILRGESSWPRGASTRVAVLATALGASYAIFSEWLNLVVRQSWAYSAWMPVVPVLGTGISPLLQWLILPPIALRFAERRARARAGTDHL